MLAGEHQKLGSVFFWRSIAYFLLTFLLSFFSEHIFLNELYYSKTLVFFILSILLFGQVLVSRLEVRSSGLLAFLLADLFFTMIVVRASGGSASPFIVVFPVVTLAGSFSFRSRLIVLLITVASLVLMSLSVGFTVSILGNALAIVATTLLGRYLIEALDDSGKKLLISESERRRLETIQKAILSNIPSGLISVDSSGRVIQVNAVGLRILAKKESEVLNHAIGYLMPEIEQELLKLSTALPQLSSDVSYERNLLSYQRKDSSDTLSLGYSVARLTDPDSKEVLGSLIVFQDLTQITKLEDELRRSEKLAAIGKLSAGIAHEIRNPLASISGSAQLLESSAEINSENASLLKIISRESFRLDALITEFLNFVKPENIKITTFELSNLFYKTLESLKMNSQWSSYQIAVDFRFDGTPCWVEADEAKLEQVLWNLLLNAGQAGATKIVISWVPEGAGFLVADNGTGIPKKLQNQIFEPFFTTKATGTGLGLSVCYRLIEAMSGTIQVTSPASDFFHDQGTMFEIKLKKASVNKVSKGDPGDDPI